MTAATSTRQIMRLGLKAVKERAGLPPRSFSRTQQDSICQCIAASCRANLLRYEYTTLPSALTGPFSNIFFSVALKSDDEQDAGSSLKNINKKTLWVILMTGGGHFVGAIFQG